MTTRVHPLAAHFPADIERLIHDYVNAFDERVINAKYAMSYLMWDGFTTFLDFEQWGTSAYISDESLPKRLNAKYHVYGVDLGSDMYYRRYRRYMGYALNYVERMQTQKWVYFVGRNVYNVIDDSPYRLS